MPFTALNPALAAAAPDTLIGAPRQGWGKSLAAMKAELLLQLGARDELGDRLASWINDAYLDLWSSLQLEESFASLGLTTVAAQPFYLLPPIVQTTLSLALIDTTHAYGGWPLDKSSLERYRTRSVVDDREPEEFFRSGQMLVLWPAPDKAYELTLDFRMVPLELVADTDCPILGREWHEAIVVLARQKAFAALMEYNLAAAAGNEFTALVRRRQDREANETENLIVQSSVPQRRPRGRNRSWPS